MIRLTASASDHGFTYALVQAGALVITTGSGPGPHAEAVQIVALRRLGFCESLA
jgi:hypothetical protein